MSTHQETLGDDILVIGQPRELVFTAFGTPKSQGNLRANKWGGVYEQNSADVQNWRDAVAYAARQAMLLTDPDIALPLHRRGTPVALTATVTIARNKADFGTGRNAGIVKDSAPRWPASGKDSDKLARAILDSVAAAGVVQDDKQIADLRLIRTYPGVAPDSLEIPGAVIRVRSLL